MQIRYARKAAKESNGNEMGMIVFLINFIPGCFEGVFALGMIGVGYWHILSGILLLTMGFVATLLPIFIDRK